MTTTHDVVSAPRTPLNNRNADIGHSSSWAMPRSRSEPQSPYVTKRATRAVRCDAGTSVAGVIG